MGTEAEVHKYMRLPGKPGLQPVYMLTHYLKSPKLPEGFAAKP
jgi:hypothetical protein